MESVRELIYDNIKALTRNKIIDSIASVNLGDYDLVRYSLILNNLKNRDVILPVHSIIYTCLYIMKYNIQISNTDVSLDLSAV